MEARKIIHGIGSPKPENVAANVRVLVSTETPKLNGCMIMPTMVAKKIASSCHAILETSEGSGANQRITLVAMEANRGFMAAPCYG